MSTDFIDFEANLYYREQVLQKPIIEDLGYKIINSNTGKIENATNSFWGELITKRLYNNNDTKYWLCFCRNSFPFYLRTCKYEENNICLPGNTLVDSSWIKDGSYNRICPKVAWGLYALLLTIAHENIITGNINFKINELKITKEECFDWYYNKFYSLYIKFYGEGGRSYEELLNAYEDDDDDTNYNKLRLKCIDAIISLEKCNFEKTQASDGHFHNERLNIVVNKFFDYLKDRKKEKKKLNTGRKICTLKSCFEDPKMSEANFIVQYGSKIKGFGGKELAENIIELKNNGVLARIIPFKLLKDIGAIGTQTPYNNIVKSYR